MYEDVAYIVTDLVAWSVGRSVCHTSEPLKNGWTDWDAVWAEDCGGLVAPGNHVLDGRPYPPREKAILRVGASHCKV